MMPKLTLLVEEDEVASCSVELLDGFYFFNSYLCELERVCKNRLASE